jgi:dihydroceramide fatty acyl 2-hydroxylase
MTQQPTRVHSAVAELRVGEIARGQRVKRNNAINAILTGAALTFLSLRGHTDSLSFTGLTLGLLTGVFYANAFEYVLHRYLLHWSSGFLAPRHALHHDSAGTPEEARYVNFSTSPWVVVLVFLLNAPAVLAVRAVSNAAVAAGMFAGFTAYYIAYEEIHWRIHFGGLPRWLQFSRRHHMLHHGEFKGRYNVFLPLLDWIFERNEWKRNTPIPHRQVAQSVAPQAPHGPSTSR